MAATTLEWGLAGMVVSVDGDPAGYALFGPAAMFAGPTGELTRPASRDAALLATMLIVPPYRGQGLGRVLLQSMARELTKRRVRRVEAFADRATGQTGCRLPAGFLERCGFVVVRDHPRVPLLRMDLRTTVRWKGVGELALDALRVPAKQALRPAPGAQPVAPASRSTVSRAPGELLG